MFVIKKNIIVDVSHRRLHMTAVFTVVSFRFKIFPFIYQNRKSENKWLVERRSVLCFVIKRVFFVFCGLSFFHVCPFSSHFFFVCISFFLLLLSLSLFLFSLFSFPFLLYLLSFTLAQPGLFISYRCVWY